MYALLKKWTAHTCSPPFTIYLRLRITMMVYNPLYKDKISFVAGTYIWTQVDLVTYLVIKVENL